MSVFVKMREYMQIIEKLTCKLEQLKNETKDKFEKQQEHIALIFVNIFLFIPYILA